MTRRHFSSKLQSSTFLTRRFLTLAHAFVLAAVVVMTMAMVTDASAQLPGENSHIQLKFILVPAKTASGKTQMVPITPIFTVPKAKDVPAICQQAVHITDTLVAYLNKYPPTIAKDRRVNLKGLGPKVVPYVNQTLGKVMVSEAVFMEGAGKELSRGAMKRLPFASAGCGRVLEEYEERIRELTGKSK